MTWRQWFSNPYLAIGTVIVLIIAGPSLVTASAQLLTSVVNQLAGVVLLLGIVVYAFRRMTGLTGGGGGRRR